MFSATPDLFRTGWFIESLLTELLIALVVRTRRPFFLSRPGTGLLILTLGMLAVTVAIPFLPFSGFLGFEPMPASLLAALVAIAVLYMASAELTKRWFYRSVAG